MRNFLLTEEHVLGTAESDAFGAERARLDGVAGDVGVGADFHGAIRVRPAHELLQFGVVRGRVEGIQLALDHAPSRAVQ